MHELKIGEAAGLLGVSVDTMRRLVDAGTVRSRRTTSGQRLVDGRALARFVVRRDRESAKEAPSGQSIRNRLPGIVTRVVRDRVAAQVEIQAGPHRVVCLLTREAVDALGLEPGMAAVATVKATNVAVEIPAKLPRAKGRT